LQALCGGGDLLCAGRMELGLPFYGSRGRLGGRFEQIAQHAVKLTIAMIPDQGVQNRRRFLVESSEGRWQLIERTGESPDILRISQVAHEGDLCRLLLEIAAELSAADTSPQLLLVPAEEVLGDVVGSLDNGCHMAVLVELGGMSE